MLTRYRNKGSSIASNDTRESSHPERCRICLKHGDIPIFGEDDLAEQVMDFGCIEIDYLDNFPQHLCGACHSLLEAAMLFRKTAKNTEEILKNSAYLDGASDVSDNLDSKTEQYDSDSGSYIKKEYLELEDTSESETEINWKSELEVENGNLTNIRQSLSDNESVTNNKDIQMQLMNVKDNSEEYNEVDNEMVMIIVSEKDKNINSSFENSADLVKHETDNHQNIAQEKCLVCNKYVSKSDYIKHMKEHREKYKRKYSKVECEVCKKKVNKSYYKYHMKIHGSAEEQAQRFVECSLCLKSVNVHYFGEHVKRVHDKNVRGKKASPKKPKENNDKKEKLLKCPVCDKMIGLSKYKEHLVKHGGHRKDYFCDQCGKAFKHPSAFKTHTLTHGSELKYQCQFCPYRGLHLGLLKIHVRTHTGDYNYKCSECPARFITKSNLSKHLKRHHGDCNFKCDICNKGFYGKRDVDKHINTVHLDLKTNVCETCGKGFGHRDNLLCHQLKVHKRKLLQETKGRIPSYLKQVDN